MNISSYPSESSIRSLCQALDVPERVYPHILTLPGLQAWVRSQHQMIMSRFIGEYDIRRWKGLPMYDPDMLDLHSRRVSQLAVYLAQKIKFFSNNGITMIGEQGLYHDATEYYSPLGDIMTPTKNKLSKQDKDTLHILEQYIIEQIILVDPHRGAMIQEYESRSDLGSQIVKLADILDALFTTVHERRVGNPIFRSLVDTRDFTRYLSQALGSREDLLKTLSIPRKSLEDFIINPRENTGESYYVLYLKWCDIHTKIRDTYDDEYLDGLDHRGDIPTYHELPRGIQPDHRFYLSILHRISQWEEDIGDMVTIIQKSGLSTELLEVITLQGKKLHSLVDIQKINDHTIRAVFSIEGIYYAQEFYIDDNGNIIPYSELQPLIQPKPSH